MHIYRGGIVASHEEGMSISKPARDYLLQWSSDLYVKGFKDVQVVEGKVPFITAKRPDGKLMRGFSAFTPKDLHISLRSNLDSSLEEGYMTFLVVPIDLMDSAENILQVWNIREKVNLEGVMLSDLDFKSYYE
jgi:hypothetical protein